MQIRRVINIFCSGNALKRFWKTLVNVRGLRSAQGAEILAASVWSTLTSGSACVPSSKCCTWAQGWAWPGCSCTSVRRTAVPARSAAWPGTPTAPGTVPPAPATGLAPASAGSAARTSGMATLPCSAWARARRVSLGGQGVPPHRAAGHPCEVWPQAGPVVTSSPQFLSVCNSCQHMGAGSLCREKGLGISRRLVPVTFTGGPGLWESVGGPGGLIVPELSPLPNLPQRRPQDSW